MSAALSVFILAGLLLVVFGLGIAAIRRAERSSWRVRSE